MIRYAVLRARRQIDRMLYTGGRGGELPERLQIEIIRPALRSQPVAVQQAELMQSKHELEEWTVCTRNRRAERHRPVAADPGP